ncbi:hypothetical protein MATL_G00055670 [Megalops atlanticus]|uniref:Uncharacterized protein n=1 Tax=Megalops atlanticus TaxID=7932 RepID=A0A9D3QGT0_MEGAT|nr:hypothetical protein MATL_G00055670 [Megalops atlanticus]
MLDREVVFEGLSALLGVSVKPLSEFQKSNPGKTVLDTLSLQDFHLSSILGNASLMVIPVEPVSLIIELLGRLILGSGQEGSSPAPEESTNSALRKELFVNESEFFDPRFDYDFTNITDRAEFHRGGEPYKRPCGWNRIALKVLDKYPDGNAWLGADNPGWRTGSAGKGWPVSYHGTTKEGAMGIIQSHYKAGRRQAYGRGIYSTPDIEVADVLSESHASILWLPVWFQACLVLLTACPPSRLFCNASPGSASLHALLHTHASPQTVQPHVSLALDLCPPQTPLSCRICAVADLRLPLPAYPPAERGSRGLFLLCCFL